MTDALKSLTTEELEYRRNAVMLQLLARESRDDLIKFTQFLNPDPNNQLDSLYSVQPHHRVIAGLLQDVESGKMHAQGYRYVCLSVGPQKGKSTLTSKHFPAWLMGRHPMGHFMFATYSDTFAWDWGDEVRAIMQHQRFELTFPGIRLRKGSKAKDHMVTEHGGKMSFVGRGGAGAGKPADKFILDDPIKNATEAASATIRDQSWTWFTRVVDARCHGLSTIFLISTRWNEDDIIGRLTDPKNPKYDEAVAKRVLYVNLPSIVEDAEIARALGVEVGASIWEERFPLELLKLKQKLDPTGFSALEMGRPTPPEGSFFKLWQIREYGSMAQFPKDVRYYGAADLAVSPERDADSSVIGNLAVDTEGDIWVHPDLFWDKVSADASVDKLIEYCLQYKWVSFFGETGQIARAVGPFLERQAMAKGAAAVAAPTLFPTAGDKGARATSIRGFMAQGRVHFPSFAPWWSRGKETMLKFTGSGDDMDDDFEDMLGLAGQGLTSQVKAHKVEHKDNVIRVGSMRWVKNASDKERAQEAVVRRLRGM